MARATAETSSRINHWFTECLKPALELSDSPECIFNVDESGFPMSGRPGHVLVRRGTKSLHTTIGGSGRENVTVQVCISGTGKLLPPISSILISISCQIT